MKKIATLLPLLFLPYLSGMEKSAATNSLTTEEIANFTPGDFSDFLEETANFTPNDLSNFIINEAMQVKQKLGDEQFNKVGRAWTADDLQQLQALIQMSQHNNAPADYHGSARATVSPHEVITILDNGEKISLPTHEFIACTYAFQKGLE